MAREPLIRPWTPDDTKLLTDLAVQGMTLARIALRMKRKQHTIAEYARKFGIEISKPTRAPSHERSLPG